MQTVTLSYSIGATNYSQAFNVYGLSPYTYRLVKRVHEGLDGTLSMRVAGFVRRFRINFSPLGGDKSKSRWLAGFLIGTNRQITIGAETLVIIPLTKALSYDFGAGVFFVDRLSIEFEQDEIIPITDTGSTRILKPTYTQGIASISGQTLTLSVNLVDDNAVETRGTDISYIDTTLDEENFFFRHVFGVDCGAVMTSAVRDWLLEYTLWQNTQLDLSLMAESTAIYDVVCTDESLSWEFQNGVQDAFRPSMITLKEKTARTAVEVYATPFILDQDRLDYKPLG